MSGAFKKHIDVWLLALLMIANASFHLIHNYGLKDVTFFPNISAMYEKIALCLTSTSILLAASGFLLSGLIDKIGQKKIKHKISRTFMWFLISLTSGIIHVALVPSHLHPDDFLELRHVSLWFWLYATGPLMYICLILGCMWMFITINSIFNTDTVSK